jgi:tyrosyl-tRNA synthetase
LQRCGHCPVAVVGGGTGMIGDPSGKSQERVLLGPDQIAINVKGIHAQLARFLDFAPGPTAARIVNNGDWLGSLDVLTFLRDTGKHFTVNYMLQKESVSRRLESEDGISFTEFTYLVLQAYDFLHLFDSIGCRLQMGGSDQWGNITAGIDLIRRLRAVRAHGLVWPLLKTSSGAKFGKTEAGTIWLDPQRTSPFRFYQFWLGTSDQDVISHLKSFTWLDAATIAELEETVRVAPERREAQRVLARDVTTLVHGEEQTTRAERASQLMFAEDVSALPLEDLLAVFGDVPATDVPRAELEQEGIALVDLIARVGLAPSKSEARRLVQGGGVYLNNVRTADVQARVTASAALGGAVFLLRKGAKQTHLVRMA